MLSTAANAYGPSIESPKTFTLPDSGGWTTTRCAPSGLGADNPSHLNDHSGPSLEGFRLTVEVGAQVTRIKAAAIAGE